MLPPPRLLLIAGTTAPASPAGLLAAAFAREIAFLDAEPTLISLADYALPLFDAAQAVPAPGAATRLQTMLRAHHAAILVAPGLDGGLPAQIRNLIEWLHAGGSVPRSVPPIFALATTAEDDWSAGAVLAELQGAVARSLGALVVGGLPLGRAGIAFDSKGRIEDPHIAALLQRLAKSLIAAAKARIDDARPAPPVPSP